MIAIILVLFSSFTFGMDEMQMCEEFSIVTAKLAINRDNGVPKYRASEFIMRELKRTNWADLEGSKLDTMIDAVYNNPTASVFTLRKAAMTACLE